MKTASEGGAYNMQIDVLKPIVEAVPLFRNIEDKEKFLIVVSALKLRLVSLAKASEIMHMTKIKDTISLSFIFITIYFRGYEYF